MLEVSKRLEMIRDQADMDVTLEQADGLVASEYENNLY